MLAQVGTVGKMVNPSGLGCSVINWRYSSHNLPNRGGQIAAAQSLTTRQLGTAMNSVSGPETWYQIEAEVWIVKDMQFLFLILFHKKLFSNEIPLFSGMCCVTLKKMHFDSENKLSRMFNKNVIVN